MCASLKAERVDLISGFSFPPRMLTLKAAGIAVRASNIDEYGKDLHLNSPDLKKIVFFRPCENIFALSKLPKEKLVLFIWEAAELHPSTYDHYSRIYTWNDELVDGVKFFKFYYPYLMPLREDIPPFEEKKLCTMVASCLQGYTVNSLYPERIKMIEFFETKPEGDFEFYGFYWDRAKYKTYRGDIPGTVSDEPKLSVLKCYRFCICFENIKNAKGYITEKIFCCLAAGCIPIYWGASNVQEYIPKDCFIDYRDFRSKEELYKFIKTMPKHIYEGYINRIKEYLQSQKASLFSPEYFDQIFYEAVMH